MTSTNLTGRRTRAVEHTRTVPHTINGITEMVPEDYTVHVPIPPRDWDRTVRSGVTTATALTIVGSIAWSTASIGDLLAQVVHPAIAYSAAGTFDLAWITCMATEWLGRYDRRKASLPRKAGHIALVIAMAAVCTHGILDGGHGAYAVGIIGALVSALAKGMWTITMRHHSTELDTRSQHWVEQQMSGAHARLAIAAVLRELARVESQTDDYRATQITTIDRGPDPDRPSGQPAPVSAELEAAIRTAIATMPGASAEEISAALVGARFQVSPDTVRAMSGQQDTSSGTVSHIAPHTPGETIADTVRRAVRAGLDNPEHVLAAVRRVHGHDVKPETVTRTLSRIAG